MIQELRVSSSYQPLPELLPSHVSFPTHHLRHLTLVFSKIFYLPPGPHPRPGSTGSWGRVWAVGFADEEQSGCRQIMHLSDSLTRNWVEEEEEEEEEEKDFGWGRNLCPFLHPNR